MAGQPCPTCGGTGQRSTARTANGRELERHERSGTPCDDCKGTGIREHPALPKLRTEREAAWNALQAAGGRGVELASEIDELDERIAALEAGKLGCVECGSDRLVAWYPEYARQGIEVRREDDGTISYDYTGEDYDHADDAGSDDEYWCLDCESHSRDLDFLVGAKDTEDVTTNDEGAMREIAAMLDGNEWSSAADYLEAIARVVRSAGHEVREPVEEWTTDELVAESERLDKRYHMLGKNARETWPPHDRDMAERIDAELDDRDERD